MDDDNELVLNLSFASGVTSAGKNLHPSSNGPFNRPNTGRSNQKTTTRNNNNSLQGGRRSGQGGQDSLKGRQVAAASHPTSSTPQGKRSFGTNGDAAAYKQQPRNFQKPAAAIASRDHKQVSSARSAFKARYSEEEGVKGADDDEEMDVAAMVAAVRQRDQELEKDLSEHEMRTGRIREKDQGVVEFDGVDYSEGLHHGGLRKRQKHSVGSSHDQRPLSSATSGKTVLTTGSGSVNASSKAGGANKEVSVVKHVPGRLANADIAPGENSAQVFGTDKTTWSGLGLAPQLVQQLEGCNFASPTQCQQQSIPVLISRRDALVKAPTGSGKTLAYLVPIIHDLQSQSPKISRAEGTYAIIIAPTRELCIQIQDVGVLLLKRFVWLVSSVLIGGEHRGHEKARLRKGVTIIVATPGRLQDHLDHTCSFKTSELRWLVLDEADRLLDLGFQVKLKEIISKLDSRNDPDAASQQEMNHVDDGPSFSGRFQQSHSIVSSSRRKKRCTVLLSATLHHELGALATAIQYHPESIGFSNPKGNAGALKSNPGQGATGAGGASNELVSSILEAHAALTEDSKPQAFSIPIQLRQTFVEVPCKDRLVGLAALLRQKLLKKQLTGLIRAPKQEVPAGGEGRKVVVFLSSCDGVELHHQLLGGFWDAACGSPLLEVPLLKLHGDMPQPQRTAAFLKFSQAKSAVLFCTDVAARGLDFPDVTNIVQYDVPGAPEEYVHRVGRTARMGHNGEALLVLMPHEKEYVQLLAARGISLQEESLAGALRWLPPPPEREARNMSKAALKDAASSGMAVACALQQALMRAVSNDSESQTLASNAFRSFVRAYATHPKDVKHIFNVRQLHLGHVAFSFGLKDAPAMIGHSGSSAERKRKKHAQSLAASKQAKKKLYTNAGPKIALNV
ncbi:hypothetical protein CEUSTIGMA_g7195.t1 [Chlamydomonas eustigma]|uniref:ATP-dependent RNA helicase n=1 Tax=Chlamydomonas eustigma TaxID=1157962 RepID=A0A250X9K3_9CHLO|nr:hypothetical protein CEUSTIGMA_g7195.t1 [Chlamydomonas eustigma]|eukprot:GAX79754.1 hypothetical protein CEUSTIGMA_g7195.t1 [Chlamydomonas eustigma]